MRLPTYAVNRPDKKKLFVLECQSKIQILNRLYSLCYNFPRENKSSNALYHKVLLHTPFVSNLQDNLACILKAALYEPDTE